MTNRCSGYGLVELLQRLNKKKLVGLEIGCSEGDTTLHLLSNFSNLKLYGIDPYNKYIDWNGNNLNEEHMTRTLQTFEKNIEPFKFNHTLVKDFSDNVVDNFKNDSLDFIFIDGLHTYDQVLKDCRNYYSKVKSGGIFSGHDFRVISEVNRAVLNFAKEVNINHILETEIDVWYWIKP